MKSLVPVLMVLSLGLNLNAQENYIVTVIRGEVYKNNIKIKIGDKLTDNQRLDFKTKESLLILLNSKGRNIVTPENKTGRSSSELVNILIKDNIHIHLENRRLSTRAIQDFIDPSDYFKTNPEINSKILIVEELKIPLNNSIIKIDNQENFYFLQLVNNAGIGINKKLNVRSDTLILKQNDFVFNNSLYTANDGIISLRLVVGYSKEKSVSKIADILPEFLLKLELVQIIKSIKSSVPNLSRDEALKELYTEIYYLFGKPDRQMLENLFDITN